MENKTLAIIKISLLSFIAFLLTIILIILLINPKKSWNIFELSSKSELVYENKIEDNIKEINVTTKAAAIEIKKSTKNYIEVKYYGEKDDKELTLTKENQILEINENKNYFCIGICNYAAHKIVISVPENYEYEINLKTTSGDINLEEINNQNLNIKTISGDVSVQKAENAKIETTSGDIEINEVNRLNAKSVSGEIIIKFLKSKCNLKTTSGDIEIDNLELLDDSDITSISGDIEIDKNLGAYIKTETLSGEVNVENNDRYAKNELKIKTTSGDIEVEN